MKLKYYGCFIFLILTGWALTSAQPSQEEKSNPDIKMSPEGSILVNNNDSVAILKDDQEKLKNDSCSWQLKIDSINREIVSKRDTLKKLETCGNKKTDSLVILCLDAAEYLLQLPYNQDNLEIVEAALKQTESTKIYSERKQHIHRLLNNYQTER